MKYMGSKARHAKELLPIILKDHSPDMWYVEPFVGGANMISKVPNNFKRFGSDTHEYLIALLSAAAKGWLPPENISEGQYTEIKNNKENYPPELVGYAGFALSYGAMWFSSYRKDSIGKRNYSAESYRGAIKEFPSLRGVKFTNKSFSELVLPKNCTIYCDPPYRDTAQYKNSKTGKNIDFDHERFYEWCRDRHKEGHKVFISEYWMPDDFVCVWSKEVNNSLTKNTGSKKGVEKLYTLM